MVQCLVVCMLMLSRNVWSCLSCNSKTAMMAETQQTSLRSHPAARGRSPHSRILGCFGSQAFLVGIVDKRAFFVQHFEIRSLSSCMRTLLAGPDSNTIGCLNGYSKRDALGLQTGAYVVVLATLKWLKILVHGVSRTLGYGFANLRIFVTRMHADQDACSHPRSTQERDGSICSKIWP